jgi:hypothetical protein
MTARFHFAPNAKGLKEKKGTGWEGMGIGCLSFAREAVDAVADLGLQAKH